MIFSRSVRLHILRFSLPSHIGDHHSKLPIIFPCFSLSLQDPNLNFIGLEVFNIQLDGKAVFRVENITCSGNGARRAGSGDCCLGYWGIELRTGAILQ